MILLDDAEEPAFVRLFSPEVVATVEATADVVKGAVLATLADAMGAAALASNGSGAEGVCGVLSAGVSAGATVVMGALGATF